VEHCLAFIIRSGYSFAYAADSSFCFTWHAGTTGLGSVKHSCQIGCKKCWDRYPVSSAFSNAIDHSCILLEVEFTMFTSPVSASADSLFDKVGMEI
jgi:hypothetical protein